MGRASTPALRLLGLALACGAAAPRSARAAEAWLLHVEAPAALALGEPQRSLFGPGAMPALGGYRSLRPWLLAGLRLRTGGLLDAGAPADARVRNPTSGGLNALAVAGRVRPWPRAGGEPSRARGPWVELAAGAGLTGSLVRPTAEAGVGWNFGLGRLTLGPALRYLHVLQPDGGLEGRDAKIALLGVELALFDPRGTPVVLAKAAPAPPPAPPPDADRDGIVDAQDLCPRDPEDRDGFEDADGCPDPDGGRDALRDTVARCGREAAAVHEDDGCEDAGPVKLNGNGDRIVLDERVLFDTNRARVKRKGRDVLTAIVALWKKHPEWDKLIVEGHTDLRGPERYNQWLSEERARRVHKVLLDLGVPGARLDARGLGRSRPRDPGSGTEAHQRNRRVEFAIVNGAREGGQGGRALTSVPPPAGDR